MYPSYDRFCEFKAKGLRSQAHQLIPSVVQEFRSDPKEAFVIELCKGASGSKINHHLWQEIVLPFAKAGLEDNPVAIQCLILTIQNLYGDKASHEDLNRTTEEQLLRRMLKFDPHNTWARTRLVDWLTGWLRYCIHEWPSGILYGANGATIQESHEILEAVEELRSLDSDMKWRQLADDVAVKTHRYISRLEHK